MKKILLIGDSISLYYSPYLSNYMMNTAEIHTKEGRREAFADLDRPVGGNGGDSSMVLSYLKERDTENNLSYDLFVFNCGLHDIKRINDGECVISPIEYRKNLLEILKITEKRGLKTAFITTTHLEDERHNANKRLGFTRYNKDVEILNEIALSVMTEEGIPVIDLGGFTKTLTGEIFVDHVHFGEEVRKLHAAFVAGRLEGLLK